MRSTVCRNHEVLDVSFVNAVLGILGHLRRGSDHNLRQSYIATVSSAPKEAHNPKKQKERRSVLLFGQSEDSKPRRSFRFIWFNFAVLNVIYFHFPPESIQMDCFSGLDSTPGCESRFGLTRLVCAKVGDDSWTVIHNRRGRGGKAG